MDTLISVGTLAAYIWSLYALFVGNAGKVGMRMNFELTLRRDASTEHLYLETRLANLARFCDLVGDVNAESAVRFRADPGCF